MKPNILNQISRFWKGRLSTNEQHELLSKLDDPQQSLVDELRKDYDSIPADRKLGTAEDYQQILSDIHEKMGVVRPIPQRRRTVIGWSVAASLLLGVGMVAYYFAAHQHSFSNVEDRQVLVAPREHHLLNDGVDTMTFHMSDGSRIALAPHSKITYTTEYGSSDRKLALTGQAKFSVAHDASRPFVVLANGYTTTALGTEFTVDSHMKNRLSVKLLSGKIMVKSTEQSLFAIKNQILTPGQELLIDDERRSAVVFDPKDNQMQRLANTKKPKSEITRSGLQFDQTPLPEVFAKIESLKGVVINLEHASLGGMSFTGRLEEHYTLEVMLSIVCQMNELSYTDDGKIIIVTNK